jgi:DnaJ-domain-containing protein 1
MAERLNDFTNSKNKYDILNVSPLASASEIKVAYRRAALLYHPDRHAEEDQAKASAIFHRISAAYHTLSDAEKRRRYDLELARGLEPETDDYRETVTLSEILMAIQTQEHMFSARSLGQLTEPLSNLVRSNLISDLAEQVIDTFPIRSAPPNAQHEGTFQSGAVVVTTLRLLFPYWTKKQMNNGNVKTIHTLFYMPMLPWPDVQQLCLVNTSRHRMRLQIAILTSGGMIEVPLTQRNVGKLILLCRYWGIPVSTAEIVNKIWDRRWLVWIRPTLGAVVLWLGFLIFSSGPLGAGVLTWCLLTGLGYFQYRLRYNLPSIGQTLDSVVEAPPRAAME